MRDVIIVGAGGGGPVVAKELAARGLDVLLLEAGPRFADPPAEWTHFDNDANNPYTGFFRFGPGDRSRPAWAREIPYNANVIQVAGVGGSTLHYGGSSPRAYPGAFRGYAGANKAEFDRAHMFPFSYRDIVPYYEWVEHTLPVQTAALMRRDVAIMRAAKRLRLPVERTKDVTRACVRPQEGAILQPRGRAGRTGDPDKLGYPEAKGCTLCGHCLQGCMEPLGSPRNLRAKRSTDNSYVPMALTADRWRRGGRAVTLVPNAFATRVITGTGPTGLAARAVAWRDVVTGEQHTEEARVIVLAAGAVETPRLWLNSALPDPNGWVGRGMTTHFWDIVAGVVPFETDYFAGPPSAVRLDFPGRGAVVTGGGLPPAASAFAACFSRAGMSGLYDSGVPGDAAGADGRGALVGRRLKDAFAQLPRTILATVMVDDDVSPLNRVTLGSVFPADEHGAVPRIELPKAGITPRTQANRDFLVGRAVAVLRAAGATQVYRVDWPQAAIHIHSTMRMGRAEADSVLDANGASRAVQRLFVADNSALANSVAGVNPTLTTQAIATRTAERIFTLHFGGQPWVGSEAPVSSIDRSVTRAVRAAGL